MEKKNKNFYTKLALAKSKIGAIAKSSTNPFYKSKYFDINGILEVVEKPLLDEGLVITQPIIDGTVTTNIVDIDSGEMITSTMKLSDQTDPQKLGSEITYYRRYTLQSLLALQAEDDDGNKASRPAPKKAETKLAIPTKEQIGACLLYTSPSPRD